VSGDRLAVAERAGAGAGGVHGHCQGVFGATAVGTTLLIQRGRKTGMGTVRGTATPGRCTAPTCPVPGLNG
jgi:hypothetical protein